MLIVIEALDSSYKYANEAYRQVNFYKSGESGSIQQPGVLCFYGYGL